MRRRSSWRRNIRLSVAAFLAALLLAELGLRLLLPGFRLSYTDARFSPRYHHAFPEFLAQARRIRADPMAVKGERTVVILGDSFVAGDQIEPSLRFTSVLQRAHDAERADIKIVNLGSTSYSTLLYERLYRDVVLPLDPDVVIVCLDQTDVVDDYLYEQELRSPTRPSHATVSDADFTDTILEAYESHPVTFFLLRHSRLFLGINEVTQALTGQALVHGSSRAAIRDAQKLRLYLDTSRDPGAFQALFENSEKYIRAISSMKPARQKLYFVTYPRAEHLAGQHKTTLLRGALPDSHASTPVFEYWIEKAHLAAGYPNSVFLHTSADFRSAIASTGLQYYFHVNDVHWTEDGHRLFANILDRHIISGAR